MYERYEKLLKENNITNYRVSKDTGITQTTLSSWKKGRITPKTDTLRKIADYFGVSLDYLTGATEDQVKPSNVEFGLRLRYLRNEKKLTEEDLGKVLGQTKFNISNYEVGRQQPDNETLKALANYFNVSVDYLLCETNVRNHTETLAFHTTGDLNEEEWDEVKKYIEFLKTKRDD